jgi:hypothetical protein
VEKRASHTSQARCDLKILPFELWRDIFTFAVGDFCERAALLRGGWTLYWRASQNLILSLISVSHFFQDIATGLLYEQVTIHDAGQLIRIAMVLEEDSKRSGGRLGALVRRVRFDYWQPPGWAELFQRELAVLVLHCPNLDMFDYGAGYLQTLSGADEPLSYFHIPFETTANATGVRHIGYVREGKGQELYPPPGLFLSCSNLTSLELSLVFNHSTSLFDKELHKRMFGNVVLPCLLSLRLDVHHTWLAPTLHSWSLPTLTHLTLIIPRPMSPSPLPSQTESDTNTHIASFPSPFVKFVAVNGRKVIYLHLQFEPIYGSRKQLTPEDSVVICQDFINACPVLNHLVLPCARLKIHWTIIDRLLSHSVHYIDTWLRRRDMIREDLLDEAEKIENNTGLPALRRVRALDEGLQGLVDLPLLVPPSILDVSRDAETGHHLLDLQLYETRAALYEPTAAGIITGTSQGLIMEVSKTGDWASDGDEFEPESDTSEPWHSSSESETDSDEEDDSTQVLASMELLSERPACQMSREEALAMFHNF